jgi:hypothetical protein
VRRLYFSNHQYQFLSTSALARCGRAKFTVAYDCGLIINPKGLRHCIEGNVVQGTSRALAEEVTFDRGRVTSTDWLIYPILDITEAPEVVDIVLINRPELPPVGVGGSSIRPVRRPRQRRLRLDRRPPAPCAADAPTAQAGAGVGRRARALPAVMIHSARHSLETGCDGPPLSIHGFV